MTRTRPAVARAGRGVAPIGIGDAKALDDEPSAGCARAMRAHDDAEDDAGSALRIAATAVTFAAANMSRASANAGGPNFEGFNVDSVEISTRRFAARMNER